MKNLFLVINKEKIYAYVVSIMTVVTIFFMSSIINSDLEKTEETSSNKMENIQNVNTEETSGEIEEAVYAELNNIENVNDIAE